MKTHCNPEGQARGKIRFVSTNNGSHPHSGRHQQKHLSRRSWLEPKTQTTASA